MPKMAGVLNLSGVAGLLSHDDWIYTVEFFFLFTGILAGSFGLTLLIRKQRDPWLLANIPGLIGFIMCLIILGWKIFYSIPVVLTTVLLIKIGPHRYLTSAVFVSTFLLLMIFRYLHYFFDVSELASQANGVQLIMTLRVIGLAFEISDSRLVKKDPNAFGGKSRRYLDKEPDLFETFNYLYHFSGLFTGPYYTYQMFLDSQSQLLLNHWSPANEVQSRVFRLVWSVPLFVVFNRLFPLDGLRSDAVWDMSFSSRIFYAACVFVVFKTRVYSAWAVAECMCVTLNIGIYPSKSKPRTVVGPTDLEEYRKLQQSSSADYDSEAIVNLDILAIEFSDGFRSGIRAWNKSVQSWLALYVHSRADRAYRVELTMFVSALWHGTYAGYFMSFLIVPMCATVEDIIFSLVPTQEDGKRPTWFRWIYTLTLRCRGFDMLATGFLLKNFHDTHRYWCSLYYWLLLVTLPIYIASRAGLLRKFRDENKHK